MFRPSDIQIHFAISPELDLLGYQVLQHEIGATHPLHAQFMAALQRVGIGEQSLGEDVLQKAVRDFYLHHHDSIETHFRKTEAAWIGSRSRFLALCDQLFGEHPFLSEVSFVAYPSIWNIFIQQPSEHAISFPIADDARVEDEALYVVLHELLHSCFYQYTDTIPNLSLRKDLWHIAEIFNSVVLDRPSFRACYPTCVPVEYPEHSKVIELLGDIPEPISAEKLIHQIIEVLDKHPL